MESILIAKVIACNLVVHELRNTVYCKTELQETRSTCEDGLERTGRFSYLPVLPLLSIAIFRHV